MNLRKENLSIYVTRVIREKGLSVRDVQSRSGGRITASYVSGIMKGAAKNLTVDKLKALAQGLGVDEDEVFRAARDESEPTIGMRFSEPQSQSLLLIDVRKKIVLGPDMAQIVEELVKMSVEDRAALLRLARRINGRMVVRKSG